MTNLESFIAEVEKQIRHENDCDWDDEQTELLEVCVAIIRRQDGVLSAMVPFIHARNQYWTVEAQKAATAIADIEAILEKRK